MPLFLSFISLFQSKIFVYKSDNINQCISFFALKNRKNIDRLFKKKESFIYTFWHDQLLICPLTWQSEFEIKVLISKHRDGDIIARLISKLGFPATTCPCCPPYPRLTTGIELPTQLFPGAPGTFDSPL